MELPRPRHRLAPVGRRASGIGSAAPQRLQRQLCRRQRAGHAFISFLRQIQAAEDSQPAAHIAAGALVAGAYLGMDRNRFNREVRPLLTRIPISIQGIAFDRLDLDSWADEGSITLLRMGF
jgi:hypothetical protein